jgi:single-strand DNA-binding protein
MDKGRQIAIDGRITTGSYKDREGKTVYTTNIIVNRAEFLGGNSKPREQTARQIEEDASALLGLNSLPDDMPF